MSRPHCPRQKTIIWPHLLALALLGCAASFAVTTRRGVAPPNVRPQEAYTSSRPASAHALRASAGDQLRPLAVNSWTSNGPAGNPGIYALALDPTNSSVIYAASRALVYKSTNGGATWSAGNGVGVQDYNGLAIARTNPNILYSTGGGTVYKSTDAGATWNPTNLASVFNGISFSRHGIAVDPTDANIVYVGTTRASDSACEVYKTSDGGASWVGTGLPVSSAISLVIDPRNRNVIYAGTFNGVTNGVWKTTAGGGNWAPTGPLGHQVWALAIDPNNSNILYAGSSFDAASDSVWKSTDGGASWTPINNGLTDPAARAIAVDPSNSNTLYLATVITAGAGFWKSTDGGASWSNFNVNLSANTGATSIVVDPTGQTVHRGLTVVHSFTYGPPCNLGISPNSNAFGTAGGTGAVTVTAGAGCAWSATTNDTWITINNGSSGLGNGTVNYTVAANTLTTPRTGTLTVAGFTYTVTQTGCAYVVAPLGPNLSFFGGVLNITINTTSPCPWSVTSNNTTFLSPVSATSGSGSGVVRFSYSANTSPSSRSGTLTIAGQTVTVTQAGATLTPPFIIGRLADTSLNGLSNAVVTLSGAVTQATRTDEQGNYAFAGLPTGANANFTVTPASPYNTFSPAQTTVAALSGNRVIDFSAVAGVIPTPTPALTDDFSGGTRNASKWNLGTLTQAAGAFDPQVSVAQQNGRLVITPPAGVSGAHYNGYVSVNSFDFANARASVEVVQAATGGTETVFGLGGDNQNYSRFVTGLSNSPGLAKFAPAALEQLGINDVTQVLVFQVRIAGVVTQEVIPYDPVQHRFWRFRHDAPVNAIVFETSPDSTTYTERYRKTLDKSVSALAVELSAGTAAPAAGGATQFDNLSLVTSAVQLSAVSFTASEGAGRAVFTVTRTGNVSSPATVSYRTVDDPAAVPCDPTARRGDGTLYPQGTAYARCDYATVVSTLSFAAGETSKTFSVPIVDDAHVEGAERVQLNLTEATGGAVSAPGATVLTVTDNDTTTGPNPTLSSPFFVRQQYLDFLSREPDAGGFNAYLNLLNNCPDVNNLDPNAPSAACDRLTVSAAFFGSQEFQLKGFFVFLFYRTAFNRLPQYTEIVPDMSSVTGRTGAEVFQKKAQFATAFTQRPEFATAYGALSNTDYVAQLLGRYTLTSINTPDPANPDGATKVTLTSADLIAGLNNNSLTRAQVLRAIADSEEVFQREFNRAFVGMQYYGYLRRTPDTPGYNAWLNYLNAHPDDYRTMVNGFMNSTEYRLRFGQP